jgi:predicted Ser/Thr protein kinase
VLHRGRGRNPDVFLVDWEGRAVVVKDFAPRARWVRATLGPWLTSREVRAYRALEGHPALPRFLGRLDRLAFALEYRPGQRMAGRLRGTLPPAFADALEEAVRAMHARGVVHLDLRHRSNVLVDEAGAPILIDFASAICFAPRGAWRRLVMPWLARIDLAAVRKWRQKLDPTRARRGGSSGAPRGASRPT